MSDASWSEMTKEERQEERLTIFYRESKTERPATAVVSPTPPTFATDHDAAIRLSDILRELAAMSRTRGLSRLGSIPAWVLNEMSAFAGLQFCNQATELLKRLSKYEWMREGMVAEKCMVSLVSVASSFRYIEQGFVAEVIRRGPPKNFPGEGANENYYTDLLRPIGEAHGENLQRFAEIIEARALLAEGSEECDASPASSNNSLHASQQVAFEQVGAAANGTGDESKPPELNPARLRAGRQYLEALEHHPKGRDASLDELHSWLKRRHGDDVASLETWKRYRSHAMKAERPDTSDR